MSTERNRSNTICLIKIVSLISTTTMRKNQSTFLILFIIFDIFVCLFAFFSRSFLESKVNWPMVREIKVESNTFVIPFDGVKK